MHTAWMLIAMMIVAAAQPTIPSVIRGCWSVGIPYDLRQPVGLSAEQEDAIRKLKIIVSKSDITVCSKTVPISSAEIVSLSADQFLALYNFTPDRIGLHGLKVIDVTINKFHSTKACGDFEDPGTHLFLSDKNVVIETGNDYFPLHHATQ